MNKNKKMLTMESKVRTFSIKCYDEQFPNGWEIVCERIKNYPKNKCQIQGIKHYKDYNDDDIWIPSVEKAHYHIIGRFLDKQSFRIKNILNDLDIVFRQGLDDKLWKNHGVETVSNYANFSVYLTHETEQAILDGKTKYDLEELVSNMTIEEIMEIRQGYINVGQNGGYKKTYQEMVELDSIARKLGYDLGNYNKWYNSLDLGTRANSKMKVIEKSYYDGVLTRFNENGQVVRLCIFIEGEYNKGKTFAARTALAGKEILEIGGGGTGKFDRLLPSHDAILIDDDVCPNLLKMSDNYMCQAYRRQSNNPFWCGDTLVVCSNLPFREWLEKSGIHTTTKDGKDNEHYRAMRSRFYLCSVEAFGTINYLACSSPSTRGSNEEQEERKQRFLRFREIFNQTMAEYKPNNKDVDYNEVVDFVPMKEGDFNPFDIVENNTVEVTKITNNGDDTINRIEYYKRKKIDLFLKAEKNVKKKFASMGIHNLTEMGMYNDALLFECASLDIKDSLNNLVKGK